MNEADKPERLLQFDAVLNEFLARAQTALEDLGRDATQAKAGLEAMNAHLETLRNETVQSTAALREQSQALSAWVAEGLGVQAQERIAAVEAERDAAKAEAEAERGRAGNLEAQVTAEHETAEALRGQVATLEQQLAVVREELGQVRARLGEAPDAAAIAAEQGRQEARLAQAQQALEARTRELAEVRENLANCVSAAEAAELREALEARTREWEASQRALQESVSAAEAEMLRREAETERTRVQELEERLRQETSRGTKSVLAEQLAEALRENEALRDQLRQRERAAAETAPSGGSAPRPAVRRLEQSEVARLRQVAAGLRDGHKRSIGEILVDAELITADQLDEALDEQRRTPYTHLGAILAKKGYTSGEAVAQALALQCGIPFVHLDDMEIDPEIARMINGRLARQRHCVPVRIHDNETLVVAMGNPLDLVAIEDIERTTNRRVEVVVAMEEEIQRYIEANYPAE